ncbi:COP9 signalosome complex subunit 3 isoform X3 [Myotis lucifugus]|uniref:COP9 signalosome complex subunit 3 isoform X3 n=1 Tax=Myotis lucifugus TaxID=59463 RepID=UPI0006D70DDF|nr:COP9 signalosome complex subunit 3 isoform X3 [Myotis lucifugus]
MDHLRPPSSQHLQFFPSCSSASAFSQMDPSIAHPGRTLLWSTALLPCPLSLFSSGQERFVKFSMPSVPDFETLFSQVQLFISTCNGEHIRYATDTFAGLCHQLTNALMERKQPLRGIGILKQAIDKMQMNTNQLTSVHADLCQLCLLAKCFKPALPYLDVDMMDICKENGAYDAKHFLCYYYYGGMIYTGLKNFERALYFYEQAITTPAMAVSHIMLESYKKYILVSLILLGKVQQLPKYTSQIVGRFIKPLSNAYHELAQVYSTNNPSELRNLVNKHSETFTRDNNMGLVKQCLSSLYKKNIQRLTKTFLTLSLQDMASRVQLSGPQEAEKYVLHMIHGSTRTDLSWPKTAGLQEASICMFCSDLPCGSEACHITMRRNTTVFH